MSLQTELIGRVRRPAELSSMHPVEQLGTTSARERGAEPTSKILGIRW